MSITPIEAAKSSLPVAGRLPYGTAITPGKLLGIECAEHALKDLGFRQCRVRGHGCLARIEAPDGGIPKAAQRRRALVRPLRSLRYTYVTVDLQGFRGGSMNETIASHHELGE